MSRNQNRHRAKPNRFQRIYETVLAVSLCVLICYYLLMSLATYLLLGSQLRLQLYTAGKYAAIAFCTAGIVYILLTLFRFENTWYRISDFFRRFRRWDVLLAALLFVWFAVIDIHAQRAQHVKGISSNFLHNDDTRMYGVFMMGVLMYSAGRVFTGETRRKAMHAVAYALTAVATLFMLWILVNFFCGNLLIDFAEEQIGFTKRLSLDIGCNPNTTGAYAALLLALDLYMIAASKKKWVKGLYIFAAFIQLFPLYLSNSRTSLFASLAFCAVFAFFLVSKRCREPWSLRAILLSLLAAAAAGGVIYGLKYVIPDAFDRITDLSEKIGAVRGVEKAGLSGRPAIWNAALTALKENGEYCLWGVTPTGVKYVLNDYLGREANYSAAHNQFIQMALAFGIPGFLIYTAWLIMNAVHCVRVGLKRRTAVWGIPLIILMLVLANLTEAELLSLSMSAAMFFWLSGWAAGEHDELMAEAPAAGMKNAKTAKNTKETKTK